MRKSSKKKNSRRLLLMIGGIVLLLFVVIGIIFVKNGMKNNGKSYYDIETRIEKMNQTTVSDAKAVGWLRVQGTNIDTPIVNYRSSLENLMKEDYLWNSTEYTDGENRKVIYGHNIRNVSSSPDKVNPDHYRFEQLLSFVYYDFAKENLYIQYNDGKEEALYKIYAVSFDNIDDEFGQSYAQENVSEYLKKARKNSIYDYDIDVQADDTLISLITCTRYFGVYESTQFRVDARRVRENEKVDRYKVEVNLNYDNIK